ncbi:hypothetical protein Vafri_21494 [Volvox africanus]|uniref:C2 domain-containing protein n=1 Tax=Volvox africanus TaxID=51714 RepID=A0A8J4BU86_9CHLO|nr:hypothetical protein Vafri_21494 [Volvox africanus]
MPKLEVSSMALFEEIIDRDPSYRLLESITETAAIDRQSVNQLEIARQQVQASIQHQGLQRSPALQRTPSFSPWLDGDFFICVSVKEAIDLAPAVPVRPATCDSFVRVTLQRSVPGALPLAEAETRVISRNCFPMWEECLPFPLDHVTEDTILNLRVMDKDIGHFNSFLGTVSLPIKEALAAARKLQHETLYRRSLLDKQNSAPTRGELVFGVAVVAKHEYKEMRGFMLSIQDPDTVHKSLGGHCLHVKLQSLKELSGISPGLQTPLVMEVTVCSFVIRKQLDGQLVGGELDPEGAEVVVPLGPAFKDGDTLKGKNRAQFGEVKVEILAGKTRLAKTQVPIWDVPVRAEVGVPGTPLDSDSEGETERDSPDRRRPPRDSNGGVVESASRPIVPKDDRQMQSAASNTAAGAAAVTPPSPQAATRRDWDGKRYSRRMERLDRCLNRAPIAVLIMQLVKAEPGESYGGGMLTPASACNLGSSAGGDVFDGADVDNPEEPLPVPAFDGVQVADFVVGLGPMSLLKTIYAEGAELMKRVFDGENVRDLKVDPWGSDPEGRAICMRSLNYMKPSPVGLVAVQSQQKVMIRQGAGFVVHQYVTPCVPSAGYCVRIFVQIVGQHVGPNKTRITAACKLEWLKTGVMVSMLKGKIEDGTPKDTRKFFDTLRNELAAKFSIMNSATGGGDGGATDAVAVTTLGASGGDLIAVSPTAAGGISSARLYQLSSSSLVVVAGVLGGLLLVLLLLMGVMRHMQSEQARTQRALDSVSHALEALSQQLATVASTVATANAQPQECSMRVAATP